MIEYGTRKGDKINDDYEKECNKLPKDPIDYMLELPLCLIKK